MGKKRKLRKHMRKHDARTGGGAATLAPAIVICVGKDCAPRSQSRALADDVRGYIVATAAAVRVELVGCLHVCKKGPIAATYPRIKFHKRVDGACAHALVDRLASELVADAPAVSAELAEP